MRRPTKGSCRFSKMLNARQKESVATPGPLIVVAGPGTGKTRALTHRAAHLIQTRGVAPENILAVTFTRAAAREMRERLGVLLNGPAPWVDTFHAAALKLLQDAAYPFPVFSVIAEEDKPALLDDLLNKKEIPHFLNALRRRKQNLEEPDTDVAKDYRRRLASRNAVDFDDLFLYAHRLFRERPEALEAARARFTHVLVDEFQDTSHAQYQFLKDIAGGEICVIGDPDQSIYGFASGGAAACFSPFEAFKNDFPAHRVVALTENYRSQGVIVEAAKNVIAKAAAPLPRELRARLERGLPVEITTFETDRQEAEMIVRRIEGLLGGAASFTVDSGWAIKDEETYSYGLADVAILYRCHAQARLLEAALSRAGLPHRVYGKTLRANGEEVTVEADLETYRDEDGMMGEGISLMTLHRSKGLEFPVVFIAGCEERLLPHTDKDGLSDVEEERRLFYVGMTRAKKRLFLSNAKKRMLYGQTRRPGPSPFLADIAEELRLLQENRAPARPAKTVQPTLFDLSF